MNRAALRQHKMLGDLHHIGLPQNTIA